MDDPLGMELRNLSVALHRHNIVPIVGGGYGLVLKARHLQTTGARTVRPIPTLRSTDDIDVFLSTEVTTAREKMEAFRSVLDELGYRPVESAKYYQFVRSITWRGRPQEVKLDLLAPPTSDPRAVVDSRRIRAKQFKGLHTHTAPEAVSVAETMMTLSLDASDPTAVVHIPHPYCFVLLKVFALRDQIDDPDRANGRHHAFDIFATIAMLVEGEWDQAAELEKRFGAEAVVQEAQELLRDLFGDVRSRGVVRMREYAREAGLEVPRDELERFVDDLSAFMRCDKS